MPTLHERISALEREAANREVDRIEALLRTLPTKQQQLVPIIMFYLHQHRPDSRAIGEATVGWLHGKTPVPVEHQGAFERAQEAAVAIMERRWHPDIEGFRAWLS